MTMMQHELFSEHRELPEGLLYHPEFLSVVEESALLSEIGKLGFRQARFKQYTARRRVVRFGSETVQSRIPDEESDFPRIDFPPFLSALRARIATWTGTPEDRFEHGLVTEYQPGTPIGWHRDAPNHETVVGISLANECRMRFRPMPVKGQTPNRSRIVVLNLKPRSIYVMRNGIRWDWQHSIPAVKALRYSITMRTQVKSPA
jgi:alkylated DNA repair dioxygenase AlkB